jgi:threonine dehydrogenase-like Zn-dependent dehydrogenase
VAGGRAARSRRDGGELNATGRVAVLAAPQRIELTSLQVQEPGPGEIRVAIEGCGLCGSNLPVWEGREWFDYPLPPGAPGHEAWGRVDAVGDEVTTCVVGDRVALLAEQALADFVVAAARDAVVLPAGLDSSPFPGEALGCGFNVAARCDIVAGRTVCVVGIGFLGAVVTAVAAHAGAEVIAVSRRASSLAVAKAMGATHTITSAEPWQVVDEVQRLTGGALGDVVVEAVGSQGPLDLAAQLLTERGRLAVAGFHQDGPRTVDMQLWNWRGIDVVNAHERDSAVRLAGIRAAVAAVSSGWFDPEPLYTHTFPLSQAGAAFAALADKPEGFVKALVVR